jgi:DNA-directed RNA polymerase beta'' subunit
MKYYNYQNNLIGKKELRKLLAWSFTNYNSMQACNLADKLKYLGFQYATKAGISISIEDLKVPFSKKFLLKKANQEILNTEKLYLKGKLTEVERFQKIIDTWNLTSESLKDQVIYYFKNYDPLNSVYIMAFSGARGNLSQVRQLVGMRGLMSDPNGEIMNLPIKKNFREGLTITDYLMSGYGARKGIVDTALKTANSGYLTRRLIDVGQDILIREKDCFSSYSFHLNFNPFHRKLIEIDYQNLLGRTLNKSILIDRNSKFIANQNDEINPELIKLLKSLSIREFYIRSPLTCKLYRAICQKCYGWDLSKENLVDIGESIGILAGQSIGEPGTQLTMRTFHTGGIFTSETRKQILSPSNGIIKFVKALKTIGLRTNKGEDVLISKNSGFICLLPENDIHNIIEIDILRNTIIFPKNNQYVSKDSVIGELLNLRKQIKIEIKPILSDNCGEIFFTKLKKKANFKNQNKLIWILSGKLYNSPINSFLNFYNDYKLRPNNSIFRTKLVAQSTGVVNFRNIPQINKTKYWIKNAYLEKLSNSILTKNYLLSIETFKYLTKIAKHFSNFYIKLSQTNQIGIQVSKKFQTLSGGILYYSHNRNKNFTAFQNINKSIISLKRKNLSELYNYKFLVPYRTIIWIPEEIHHINSQVKILFVKQGDFISAGFELIPNRFSKTSGMVKIFQKNNIIQSISIKPGLVYQGKKFKFSSKKLYYPGEVIFSSILISNLSFCEEVLGKKKEQLLLRHIELYEVPRIISNENKILQKNLKPLNGFLKSKILYIYNSFQTISGIKNVTLVSNVLSIPILIPKIYDGIRNIQLKICSKKFQINFCFNEKINLRHYLFSNLKYKNLQSSFLIQFPQFIDFYTILGYLESINLKSLEIVKIKIKRKKIKKILLISNEDCFILKKQKLLDKKINDFILNKIEKNNSGKIIFENHKNFIIQRGIPYFFPNCKAQNFTKKSNIQYKLISKNQLFFNFLTTRNIRLNYFNILNFNVKKKISLKRKKNKIYKTKIGKTEFLKVYLKRNGKLYSSLIPNFVKKLSIKNSSDDLKFKPFIQPESLKDLKYIKVYKTLLLKSSGLISNKFDIKKNHQNQFLLMKLVKFKKNSFLKSNKSIGIYSITEDYFEEDLNSIFCKNREFIENGETLGLLKLEKELTGDIVQGLPRIEQILEARKIKSSLSKIPSNKKKGLLIQNSSLDPTFEFKKLGFPIQETHKINPHKLLKVYFNYYGLQKNFMCEKEKIKLIKWNPLVQNYEASYRSFKKIQSFILNSVQSIYKSQGVEINDKHLEIIIKQMTTKVVVTSEGNTPLLRREVIDLYHIEYINKVVKQKQKKIAFYVPLVLGITKAALNNPSFLSAASFQETTRVLTKAAIEGRIDWLRGLKENIIIGHLIPAGTGSQNYKNSFRKKIPLKSKILEKL